MSDFAFMAKTLLRPHCLDRLLGTLREQYPDAPVWIADDSPEPYPEIAEKHGPVQVVHHGAEPTKQDVIKTVYATFPYDVGIGTCYNWMIDRIPEPYIVLLDDDFAFTDETRVERFIPFLRSGAFDLVGGDVYNVSKRIYQGFCGHFTSPGTRVLNHSTIHLRKVPRGRVTGPVSVEVTMNFFMAKTEVLRDVRWDPDLKVCRHEDFFLRFSGYRPRAPREPGYKAAFWRGVIVNHENRRPIEARDQQHDYNYHRRGRFQTYRNMFVRKYGFEFV